MGGHEGDEEEVRLMCAAVPPGDVGLPPSGGLAVCVCVVVVVVVVVVPPAFTGVASCWSRLLSLLSPPERALPGEVE